MKECLWKKVTDNLTDKIRKGRFNKAKFPTLSEICKEYEVSGITARRALSELAALDLIKRSTKTGSSIIKKSSSIEEIFLIAPAMEKSNCETGSIIHSQITQGIIEEAAEQAIKLKIISPAFLLSNIESCRELNLIAPALDADGLLAKLTSAKNMKKRIVQYHSLFSSKEYSTIRSDLKNGAVAAVKHLFEKGHSRIAFVTAKSGSWFVSRLEGYTRALTENGLEFDLELVKGADKENYEETAEAIKVLMALKNPPTAIFAATDIHALHILRYCRNAKIKIPGKLAVCGFDNLPESEFYMPPLTTVDTNWKKQGREAVRLFLNDDFLKGKIFDIKTKPELVIRKSS